MAKTYKFAGTSEIAKEARGEHDPWEGSDTETGRDALSGLRDRLAQEEFALKKTKKFISTQRENMDNHLSELESSRKVDQFSFRTDWTPVKYDGLQTISSQQLQDVHPNVESNTQDTTEVINCSIIILHPLQVYQYQK